MNIRNAKKEDILEIRKIYEYAKKFMDENGNPTQWSAAYPGEDMIQNDIQNENCFVCENEGVIVGVFTFLIGEDPTYLNIEQGNWNADRLYGTIHRLASNGQVKSISKVCFDYCKGKVDYLRIDTHADNKPMQAAILKNGFQKCGIIYAANGSERIAFDYRKSSAI